MSHTDFAFFVFQALLAALLLAPCLSKTGARWFVPLGAIAGVWLLLVPDPRGRAPGLIALLLAAAIAISLWFQLRTSRRLLCGLAAVSLAMGLNGILRVRPPSPGQVMAAKYPLVSIAPRLEYESKHRRISAPEGFSPDILVGLKEQDSVLDDPWNTRQRMLEMFHSSAHRWFNEQEGFGVTRMGQLTPDQLILPPSLEPLPEEPTDAFRYGPLAGAQDIPEPIILNGKHLEARNSFLLPAAFGYVRDRDHVAGFASHAFRRPLAPRIDSAGGAVAWNMTKLQLVSLLRFDAPRVYETRELPEMTDLKGVPTRPLTEFESDSLPRLVAQQDVVVEEEQSRIHMLGSLRASKTCLQCHEVSEGTLLGAFSYVFSRIPAAGDIAKNPSELH